MLYESLCESVHGTLINGKCPWCGHIVIDGRDSEESLCDVVMRKKLQTPVDEVATRSVLSMWLNFLKDANALVRAKAATWLAGLPPPYASDALPALSLLLEDHDEAVRDAAEKAIKRIGEGSQSAG